MLRPVMLIERCILAVLSVALASAVFSAESVATLGANRVKQEQPQGQVAGPIQRGGNRPGRAVTAAPVVGMPTSRTLPKQPALRTTVAGLTPNLPSAHAVVGLTGSAVGRHAALSGAVGGPATYNPKKGAVISGSAIRGKF